MKSTTTLICQAILLALLSFSIGSSSLLAQMRVGQPTATPDPSSALEVSGGPYSSGSQYRGIAPPKVALTRSDQASPVDKPIVGLLVYNTAATGDLIPGYYYWEGSKWVRFVTASSATGAARLGSGQPVPAYTINQVHNQSISDDNIIIVDLNREGLFRFVSSDSTSNNDATVIIAANNRHYVRVFSGPIDARWFGAIGDGITDDTQALQAAATYTCKANNPYAKGAFSPARLSNTLYIPHGVYNVNGEINLFGACHIQMEEVTSYGGTRIVQKSSANAIFHIKDDNDGTSSAVKISGGILIGGSPSFYDIGLIYAGEESADGNNSSTYIERTWFRTPAGYGIVFKQGGDIQIRQCTFDVIPFHCVKLGSATHQIDHVAFVGNTVFGVKERILEPINVRGLVVTGNTIWNNDGDSGNSTLIYGQTSIGISGLEVSGNVTRNINNFAILPTFASGVNITGNSAINVRRFVQLTGGGVLYGATISNNTANLSGSTNAPPFDATGCGLQGSAISGNVVLATASGNAAPAFKFSDNRVFSNQFGLNVQTNFSALYDLNQPEANGIYDIPALSARTTSLEKKPPLVRIGTAGGAPNFTFDASAYDCLLISNYNNAITVTVDLSKLVPGQVITLSRYFSSTGPITVAASGGNSSYVFAPDGSQSAGSTISIATAAGQRSVRLMFDGHGLIFLGY